jgi:hypothetical protein
MARVGKVGDSLQSEPGGVGNDVSNAKWFQYTVPRGLPEWLPGDLRREPGDYSVPGIGIAELLARGRLQRQLTHLIDDGFDCRFLSVPRLARTKILRQAGHMAKELSGANRRAEALERRIDTVRTGGGTGTELGYEPPNWFIERNLAVIDKRHERRGGNRFGH